MQSAAQHAATLLEKANAQLLKEAPGSGCMGRWVSWGSGGDAHLGGGGCGGAWWWKSQFCTNVPYSWFLCGVARGLATSQVAMETVTPSQ